MIKHGADVEAVDDVGHETPLVHAIKSMISKKIVSRKFQIIKGLKMQIYSWIHSDKKLKAAETLLENEADPNVFTKGGDTLLMAAVREGN